MPKRNYKRKDLNKSEKEFLEDIPKNVTWGEILRPYSNKTIKKFYKMDKGGFKKWVVLFYF